MDNDRQYHHQINRQFSFQVKNKKSFSLRLLIRCCGSLGKSVMNWRIDSNFISKWIIDSMDILTDNFNNEFERMKMQ